MQNKDTKDLTHTKQIKDENEEMLTNESKINERWKKYFEWLVNEKNQGVWRWNIESSNNIGNQQKTKKSLKMKNNKVTGPDKVPIFM